MQPAPQQKGRQSAGRRVSDVPIVEFRDVSFTYDGAPVLQDVTLAIEHLESVCVVGPNGGGKTTLLKLALGLLRPQRGQVRVFGDEPARQRRRMGYMPQQALFDPQFPVTVMDVVLMGRVGGRLGGAYGRRDRQAALAALGEVELSELASRSFADLSGGQRQRVLLARALACEPELLLLDEPTASVDTQVEARLFEILARLNERMTVVMVSHDRQFVSSFVERVVCVNRRVIVHPTSEITDDVIKAVYAGDMRMVRHDQHCGRKGRKHG